MDFNALAKLRRYLELKHHIPGRMRIKFDSSIRKDPQAMALAQEQGDLDPSGMPGVTNIRTNLLARSVVIEYDPTLISPQLLEELATTKDANRAAEIAEQLYTTLHAN